MKIFELNVDGIIENIQTTLKNINAIAKKHSILEKKFINNNLFIYTKYDLFVFNNVKCKTLEIFIEGKNE